MIARRTLLASFAGALAGGRRAAAETAFAGPIDALSISSRATGATYPIRLYAPPASLAGNGPLPIVYLLDAEWRLPALATIAEARRLPIRIAGIANEATRNHDDVPANACIPGGGGEAAFFDFVSTELVPFVEARVPVAPGRRALMGHSFGGAFVLYALFHEAPEARLFSAYLAADPSIRCVGEAAYPWEAAYAASTDRLPARVHFAYANPSNAPFAERIESRGYRDLRFVAKAYAGGHDGMIPAAFADALDFAFS